MICDSILYNAVLWLDLTCIRKTDKTKHDFFLSQIPLVPLSNLLIVNGVGFNSISLFPIS
jgi:hypothetical protein